MTNYRDLDHQAGATYAVALAVFLLVFALTPKDES